jgi:hypothetical protein
MLQLVRIIVFEHLVRVVVMVQLVRAAAPSTPGVPATPVTDAPPETQSLISVCGGAACGRMRYMHIKIVPFTTVSTHFVGCKKTHFGLRPSFCL